MEAEKERSKLEFSKSSHGIPRSTFQELSEEKTACGRIPWKRSPKASISPGTAASPARRTAASPSGSRPLLPRIPARARRRAAGEGRDRAFADRLPRLAELMHRCARLRSRMPAPEGTYRYFLQETWQPARMRCSHGLLWPAAAKRLLDDFAVISFSDDRAAVQASG